MADNIEQGATTTGTIEFMISDWQDRYHRSLYDDDAGKAAHNIVNRLGAIGLGLSYCIRGKLEARGAGGP